MIENSARAATISRPRLCACCSALTACGSDSKWLPATRCTSESRSSAFSVGTISPLRYARQHAACAACSASLVLPVERCANARYLSASIPASSRFWGKVSASERKLFAASIAVRPSFLETARRIVRISFDERQWSPFSLSITCVVNASAQPSPCLSAFIASHPFVKSMLSGDTHDFKLPRTVAISARAIPLPPKSSHDAALVTRAVAVVDATASGMHM